MSHFLKRCNCIISSYMPSIITVLNRLQTVKKIENAERKELKKKHDEAKKESHNREKEIHDMAKHYGKEHHGDIKNSITESSSTNEKMMRSDKSEHKNKDKTHEGN